MSVSPDDKTDPFVHWRDWFRATRPLPVQHRERTGPVPRRARFPRPLGTVARVPKPALAAGVAIAALGLAALAWAAPARIMPHLGRTSSHTASGLTAVPGPGVTATVTATVPGHDITAPVPVRNVTATVTATAPGRSVTETVTASTTETVPAPAVTETVTAPAVTITVTAPAVTVTPAPTG